jgi:glycogen debranching enzyme
MPVQISVGPPVITINQSSTFMVTDHNGEVAANSEQGIFYGDTRLISHYKLFANNLPWTRLSSSPITYYSARIHLTNQTIPTEDVEIPAGTLGLTISRAVEVDGLHEDFDLANYGLKPVKFNLELELYADFADLFEVKSHDFVRRGHIDSTWTQTSPRDLDITYVNRDFARRILFHGLHSDSPGRMVNGRITWEVVLGPKETWRNCHHVRFSLGLEIPDRPYHCIFTEGATEIDQLQKDWQERATKLESSNEDVRRAFLQSVEDMGALRLFAYDVAPDVWLPAAGVPWFVTLFGRDSLIVSHQNTLIDSTFAHGALATLARYQATEVDPFRDAEPGKILHELRVGELAHFKRVPHTPYYGTAEATALYLITLHEAWRWMGDDNLLHEYRDVALKCLRWIDRYGDLDDDGFQEYQTHSSKGYENMGWKDAWDAVVYPDGSQVKQPKALCELQGYTYDAYVRMGEIFEALGEPEAAANMRQKASDLQRKFEERFWCEDIGFYAYGLDPEKKPIKTIASNAGHCLATGIVSPEHAERVVKRFFEPDMWSGWGIRTLSSANPAYNPFSYQNGSVWPHDNGIIALGFKRYGFAAESARVAKDVIDAAACFVSYRLPELYAGVERRPGSFPVQYLGANVPQAWAAGSIFHFLKAILGIQADAPHGRLYVDPTLPDWLPDVTLRGLKIGGGRIDIRFWREGKNTRWDVLSAEGGIEVEQRPLSLSQVTTVGRKPNDLEHPSGDSADRKAA